MKAGFVEKLIGRLGKIGPEDVQNYFLRLAQEKGFLETVFNSIQEGIIVTDSKGRITYLNNAACQLFGLEAEDSLGRRLDERVRGLDWNALSREGAVSRDMEIFYPTNRFINFYSVPLVIEPRTDDSPSPAASPARTSGATSPCIPVVFRRVPRANGSDTRLFCATLPRVGAPSSKRSSPND